MSEDEAQFSHTRHVDELDDDVMPRFHRPRELGDTEMDITPMIDITFLLLIFFLVASRIDSQSLVDLPQARYGTTVPIKESVILTVDQGTGDTARVYRGDGAKPENEFAAINLIEQEQDIVEYIQNEMIAASPPKRHVIIKAGATVKHREVARVADAVGKVEKVQQLHIAVLEEK